MRPVVIAHRGASGHFPEHSLPAKALAYAMGADYLEQDIVASRDDELLVLHDIHLDRVTDVSEMFPGRARADGRFYARDFDLAEIRQLRIHERTDASGARVFARRFASDGECLRIPTLAEELRFIADLQVHCGRRVGIYPEIKRPAWHREEGIDLGTRVVDTLASFNYCTHNDPVYLQCFDADELQRIRHDLGCELKLVQLIGDNSWGEGPTDFDALRGRAGLANLAHTVDGIGPWVEQLYRIGPDGTPVDTGLVGRAHEHGLVVHPYTFRCDALPKGIDKFDDLLRYCVEGLAIDGLFTDFPGNVFRYLATGSP